MNRQRGFSLVGVIVLGILGAIAFVIGAQVVPTVNEYQSIKRAVQRAAQTGTTPEEIRSAFDRAKSADYFQAISGKDLQIRKSGNRYVVEFAYDKEIHLVGPAYLVLKYRGRSE